MKNADQKAFFQSCLYTALIELMDTHPYEKISIGDLCDKAGVSRMTYYRSYNDKDDILIQHLDACFIEYLEDLKLSNSHSIYDISCKYFSLLSGKEKNFFTLVVKSGRTSILMERFYIYYQGLIDLLMPNKEIAPYIRSYLTGGLYKITIDWINNGMDITEEEMAELLMNLAHAVQDLK